MVRLQTATRPSTAGPRKTRGLLLHLLYAKPHKNNVCHLNIYLCSVWNCLSSTIFLSLLLKHFETWTFPSLNVKPNRWKEVGHLFNFPRLPSPTLTSGALSNSPCLCHNSETVADCQVPGCRGQRATLHTHKM